MFPSTATLRKISTIGKGKEYLNLYSFARTGKNVQVCQAVKKLGALAINLVPLSETGCGLSDSQALDFSCFTIWCDATMMNNAAMRGSKKELCAT